MEFNDKVDLTITLHVEFHKDGDAWVAFCPRLDVGSQAETKDGALAAVREAVELWFESCLERSVLREALIEAGFTLSTPEHSIPDGSEIVRMATGSALATSPVVIAPQDDSLRVSIPAFMAAALNAQAGHAAH